MMLRFYMTSAGIAPYILRGEAATFIPHSSFLIPHSSKTFIHNQRGGTPHGLTLNP